MRKVLSLALLLAAGVEACNKKYTAVAGDNCEIVGRKNGITAARVKELNNFVNCNDIWAWTPLCVDAPVTGPCTKEYRSVAGDNCDIIGQKHGISGARVKEMNNFVNCNDIWAQTPICVQVAGGPAPANNNNNNQNGRKIKWQDEFDGNAVDWSKWRAEEGGHGWGNNELQFYTARTQNAFVSNGMLTIQALKEDFGGRPYTSARLITNGKYDFKYGRIEARIKVPNGQGTWPAFWTLGSNIGQVGWPACGEIDIMETVGRDIQNTHASTHAPAFDTTWHKTGAAPWSDDFHVYAVEWKENSLEFFADGELIHKVTAQPGKSWPFNSNNYILLNLAIGGTWPGNPDGSTPFPRQMIVDYVRVYE